MDAWIDSTAASGTVPLFAVDKETLESALVFLGESARQWCKANQFSPEPGRLLSIPGANGTLSAVLVGVDRRDGVYALASLPFRLAEGNYALDTRGVALDPQRVALGWALGAYHYTRYRKLVRAPARLAIDANTRERVTPFADAAYRVRDLVNAPAEALGPAELAGEVHNLAKAHHADYHEWVGDELLSANFPAIHAVGRASHRAPRLAMLTHGDPAAPHVVLVGKGVCFDTGGLDLKTSDGMRWMKKDMGGAAHAIALAELVLRTQLPVRLTLLIPTVENAVAANAYRPGDVIRTRGGITVEVDNTDAEGRLILCDALAYAAEQKPDLILDFATLTGAARIALGPDLPGLFSNRDELADALLAASRETQDPLWRLPLWRPYGSYLDSHLADMANAGASRHAGAITAAIFLERFIPEAQAWCHLDVYSWNDSDKPGRPRGGEAQGLRAYFEFLKCRYQK